MSFSGEFRHTLLVGRAKSGCCRIAFVYGYLTGAGVFSDDQTVRMNYTDPDAVGILSDYLPSFDRSAKLSVEGTRRVKTMTVVSRAAAVLLSSDGAVLPDFRCSDCKGQYLSGLFASCGRISDPSKGWRLEFSCGEHRARVEAALSRLGVSARRADRRDEQLLYLRSSSEILDFFALMGENDFYFGLMNGSIEREIRNSANRLANCEANNIAKAISASDEQVRAIRYLEEHRLMGGLEPALAESARLRLEHPDMTLSQLSAIAVPPVSRAGLNHRLRRLCEIADRHRAKYNDRDKTQKRKEAGS